MVDRTALGNNYETLDELTQLRFIFEYFDEIFGPEENGLYLGRWKTHWTAIEGAWGYFDKITEELVDPDRVSASSDSFLQWIAETRRENGRPQPGICPTDSYPHAAYRPVRP